jgi:hypothetical protein
MKRSALWTVFFVLLGLAFVLNALGGSMDIAEQEKISFFSKTHAWHDALFILGLAALLLIYLRA